MTPAEFATCLTVLHWSHSDLARELSVHRTQVVRWANGSRIPDRVVRWLEMLAAMHRANPPPFPHEITRPT